MEIIDFILHLDDYLAKIINLFGSYTYIILFLIIFAETGLVVTPFLPGDSLLFVIGTLSGSGFLNIWISYLTLLSAAILGDTVNYWIGHHLGTKVFSRENSRLFSKANLEKTRLFYEKHGGKTIILARFLPILRTFAPFVAGVGKMHYSTFLIYNLIGGFVWVTGLTFAGYFFGGLAIIKENFEYAVIGIVLISLIPLVIEYLKHKRDIKKSSDKTSYQDIQKTFKKEHLTE
ncbi:DedA family protein [Candidatus Gottesmanbacteria bacterium]|nr:DedA family protein [Candidatus Gottesmanbacteria bacterium]